MYTVCPECTTVFRITAGHLQAASGLVRCGKCHHLYSAVQFVFDDMALARAASIELRAPGRQAESATYFPAREPADLAIDSSESIFGAPYLTSSAGDWRRPVLAWRDVISGGGIGLLILLLAIQWLYFNRAELAGLPGWRPTMERFCSFLQCELPLRVDLGQIELLDRDVRKHPTAKDALLINATIINHARFVQPYPLFSVSFSDLSGNPVAVRHFRPAEYLGDGAALQTGMIPDTAVHVLLEIEDPGKDAVSYQLDFL